MNAHRLLPLAILMTAIGTASAADGASRDDRLAKGEIIVETKDVKGAGLPRADVYAVVDAPVARIQKFLEDCRRYPGRMPRIEKATLVKQEGNDFYCQITVDMPFPLSDLVSTTKATHTIKDGYFQRKWTLVEGDYERSDGAWTLKRFQGNANRTLVHYWVLAVPDISIPNALASYGQRKSLPGLMETVRKEVAKPE